MTSHAKKIQLAKAAFEESITLKKEIIQNHLEILVEMAGVIAKSILSGHKLFICGNGGSLSDAQHLVAELLIRLHAHTNRRSLPAICLGMDMSTLTACGNDYGFDHIFSRPLEGLGQKGDVLLGITTSGKSPNVIKAFQTAKTLGIKTLGFLGGNGPGFEECDLHFTVPSYITARIQECHITAGHVMMELTENIVMKEESPLKSEP